MKTPSFYKSNLVGQLRFPDVTTAIAEGRNLRLPNFSHDKLKTMLLLVDPQLGFISDGRPLAVKGGIGDTQRTIEWIFRNLEKLTYIATSLDTHLPFQIASTTWWVGSNGKNVDPFTLITLADYKAGKVKPLFDFDYEYEPGKKMKWAQWYLTQLAANGKDGQMAWPPHCELGSPEHAVEPSLFEAIWYHAGARSTQPHFEIKGDQPYSENYSIMEKMVHVAEDNRGGVNEEFLGFLENYDLIYVAGEAWDFCVYETVNSIVRYFTTKAPDVLSRLRIMVDAISPVFPNAAVDAAFQSWAQTAGLKLVKSTDPIG